MNGQIMGWFYRHHQRKQIVIDQREFYIGIKFQTTLY